MSFSSRLNEAMREKGLRQVDLLERMRPACERAGIDIPRSALSQYVNGRVVPRKDKATIIANALGVQLSWLMCYDDNPDRRDAETKEEETEEENKEAQSVQSLDDAMEMFLLVSFRNLSSQGKRKSLNYVLELADEEQHKERIRKNKKNTLGQEDQ